MNERIKELIEQATTKEEFYPAGCNGHPDYRYDFNKEKFAELLIEKFAYGLMDLHGSSPEHIVYAAKLYGVEL